MKIILAKKHDLIGASLQWCHNKNCCVTPGFSRFGNTAKKPWFWFYPFWVLVAIEQRDTVTLCSNHSSVNVSLYPRRKWQIWQHKKILALGHYSELCQGELATQVLRNIFKISWYVKPPPQKNYLPPLWKCRCTSRSHGWLQQKKYHLSNFCQGEVKKNMGST